MADHLLRGMRFPAWVRLLRRHRIDPRHWLRALDIGLTSLACLPMDLVEELRWARRRREVQIPGPVFVLGHWRSGTTWLQQLMDASDQLAYVSGYHCGAAGRFLSFPRIWRVIMGLAAFEGRPMDAVALGADEPAEEESAMARVSDLAFDHCFHFPRDAEAIVRRAVLLDEGPDGAARWKEAYRDVLARVTLERGGRRLLLKSPANTARVEALRELFPDARFVHIVRSPYEVFPSTRKMWRSIIAEQALQDVEPERIDAVVFATYRRVMERYRDSARALDRASLTELRYEELCRDPGGTVRTLFAWLGCPWTPEAERRLGARLAATAGYAVERYSSPQAELDRIEAEWGEWIRAYGYPRPAG